MASKDEFTGWLCEYLNGLGLDGDIYGEYIASSLQELKEATEEERMEAVHEFVSGALVRSMGRGDHTHQQIINFY